MLPEVTISVGPALLLMISASTHIFFYRNYKTLQSGLGPQYGWANPLSLPMSLSGQQPPLLLTLKTAQKLYAFLVNT